MDNKITKKNKYLSISERSEINALRITSIDFYEHTFDRNNGAIVQELFNRQPLFIGHIVCIHPQT